MGLRAAGLGADSPTLVGCRSAAEAGSEGHAQGSCQLTVVSEQLVSASMKFRFKHSDASGN